MRFVPFYGRNDANHRRDGSEKAFQLPQGGRRRFRLFTVLSRLLPLLELYYPDIEGGGLVGGGVEHGPYMDKSVMFSLTGLGGEVVFVEGPSPQAVGEDS